MAFLYGLPVLHTRLTYLLLCLPGCWVAGQGRTRTRGKGGEPTRDAVRVRWLRGTVKVTDIARAWVAAAVYGSEAHLHRATVARALLCVLACTLVCVFAENQFAEWDMCKPGPMLL